MVEYKTKEPPGTLIVDTQNTYLYLVLEKGKRSRSMPTQSIRTSG
jgi:hypothetical protein